MEHCFCCTGRVKNNGSAQAEEMIAMVSHDLRAPLTSILFSLELMAMELENNASESVQEELTVAKRNASRLIGMIDQLLGAQQVRNQKWPPISLQRLRLSTLMEQAVENVRSIASNKNITIQGFLTAFESTGSGNRLVDADGDRLLQVIINLLSNAIKFSPNGSKIFISAKQVGKNVEVMIEDEGPGVAADMQQAIFAPYVQAHRRSTTPGVGLGLAICREIVEQHKGSIGVRDRQTGGSAFWFAIPMRAQQQSAKVVTFPTRKNLAVVADAVIA